MVQTAETVNNTTNGQMLVSAKQNTHQTPADDDTDDESMWEQPMAAPATTCPLPTTATDPAPHRDTTGMRSNNNVAIIYTEDNYFRHA